MTDSIETVIAEMRERVVKAAPDDGLIGPDLVTHWADRLAALNAAPIGKPVALVHVGSQDHGPFYFRETAHGVDILPDGETALYMAPTTANAS